jgi:hypothetical protein
MTPSRCLTIEVRRVCKASRMQWFNKRRRKRAHHDAHSGLHVGTAHVRLCPPYDSYASNTASAPFTASAESVTVFSSEGACTEMFSAKNRASVT